MQIFWHIFAKYLHFCGKSTMSKIFCLRFKPGSGAVIYTQKEREVILHAPYPFVRF